MFLHINTFGQQISLHSKDATEAVASVEEVKDDDGNTIQPRVPSVPTKPAHPLKVVINDALKYWKLAETDIVALFNGKRLDLDKTAGSNALTENDLVTVVTQKSLDEAVTIKEAELASAKKLAGK